MYLKIKITINKKIGIIIIDLGTIGNFITKEYTKNKKYSIKDKKQLYRLINLNNIFLGNNEEQKSREIILLSVVSQKYHKEIVFNVINIVSYNIILRILQLKKYSFQINQKRETLIIKYKYPFDLESYY